MLGKYKKRWLSYLNKETFDHTQGPVDPFTFHTSFLLFAKLFSVMDYEKLPWWMYITQVSVVCTGVLAAILFLISVINYVRTFKVHLITECGTYFLVMCYKLLIISCTFRNKKYYHSLLRTLRLDFQYICTKGIKYRDRFFENQRLTFKSCILVSLFIGSIGSGMAISGCISLAVYICLHDKDNRSNRPLPYPYWLFDYDLQATPAYEILFFLSMVFTFSHTYTYIFMMKTHILWVRQITCKADVITWSIQDLLVDMPPAKNEEEKKHYALIIRHRMREIVSMHHSMIELMMNYAAVYKKCLLLEQKVTAPIICMSAFCAVEKYEAGEIDVILPLLCGAVIVLGYIPSYLCTFLLEKVQSVSDACWDTPFWNAGPVIRPYLVLIMQRSVRPLPIVAAGFEDITLTTYSNTLTRAYSCFNMLRQGNVDIS